MKYNSKTKAFVFAVFTVFMISSAFSVTSEFTTDMPDTQQVNQEFTISGEVSQDYSWEQDFESIMIQSSPEGSSTWFVEKEKDIGCFGSSCTISSDTISHSTAENVEYRIVALNNAGTTVPYNPETRTVEFVNEQEPVAELKSVGASDYSVSESDGSTTLQADVKNNRGSSSYVHVTWKADGETIDDKYSFISANSRETVTLDVSYSDLGDQLDKDTDYELSAVLDYRDVNEEKTASQNLRIESQQQEERWVRFQNMPDNYEKDESHSIEAKAHDSEANLWNKEFKLQYRKDGGWNKISSKFCFPYGTTHECTVSGTFQPSSSGDYDLRAKIPTQDGVTLSKKTTVNVESTETESVAKLNKVYASSYKVTESEGSTTLKADVKNNRDYSSYVHVIWKADGTEIDDKYAFISANSEETITKQVSYSDLSNELQQDTEYDLKGVLDYRDVNEEMTASNTLVVKSSDTAPVAQLNDVYATDYSVSESDGSTTFKADVRNNRDYSSYVHVTWKADGEVIEDRYSFVSSNSEETISTQISYGDLSDQFNPDTEHELTAVLDYRDVNQEKAASQNLVIESTQTTEPVAELKSVSASDYSITSSEGSTTLKTQVKNNKGSSSYVHVRWLVDGTEIEDKYSFVSANSKETISKQISYSELEDEGLNPGTGYTLKGNLQYRDVDVTKKASKKISLVRQDSEDRLEISNVRSTDTNVNPGEATQFKADLSANEDIGYLDIDFYVNDQNVANKQVTGLDSGETRTLITTKSWDSLESEFNTGENHDLKVRASNYRIDVSQTKNNAFYLNSDSSERPSCQEFDEADLDIDLENFESIPEEGNSYDSSVRLYNNGDRDLGGNLGLYIKESNQVMNCDYYNDHYDDLVGFTGSNVYPDSGSSDAFDFSYSGNPIDDLEYGETYSLVAVFSSDSTTYVGPAGAIQWRESESQESSPTARFSWDDHPATAGENVRFDGSGSTDPDGDIEQYRWDFDDGSGYQYGRIEDHSFGTRGTYDVTLRVRDSQGNTDTRTRQVEVLRDPGSCSINVGQLRLGDSVIDRGDSTTASVQVTNDGDRQDVRVRFKIGSNTVKTVNREISSGSHSTFQASVGPDRDRIITAQVTTQGSPCGDRTYERYRQLSVVDGGDNGDQEDRPEARFSWSPSQPEIDQTVTFDASESTDSDGDIVEYKWFFGDGSSPGYGRTVQHSYRTRGDYDVQLVVEDSEGNTDSETVTLPVREDPGACSVAVGGINFEDAIINEGESTRASVSVSNLGDRQRFEVEFRSEGQVLDTREARIDSNSQRTFSTSISPNRDRIITAKISTQGEPCGYKDYERYRELVVLDRPDQQSTLDVNVRNQDGMRLSNARVSVQGGNTDTTRYTGYQGEAYFELGSGNYDVAVSRSGYQTEVRSISLNSGSDRTMTVTLGRRASGQGTLTALVEDGEGNRLRNAEITVRNGVTKYRETGTNGRTTINLDEGIYEVTAEKTGYGSWTETVNIDRGEETTRVFRLTGDQREGLNIADIDYSNSVCRGSTLRADVTIENNEQYHEFVSLTGKGLGSINAVSSFSLDAGETVEKTVYFTNVKGSGNEQFTITASNDRSDSTTRTVNVESCGKTATGEPTDISMQLDYTKQPNMAVAGDILKVEGFVDGANGRSTVDIEIDGETKASVRTQPDGYYRTWITASEVGSKTVTASSGGVSDSRPLRVIPTSRVTNIEVPVSIFEGQTYQVCARVESQIEPEVILERDGEVITSKTANDRVCFEQEARDPGMHKYRIAALTSGTGNTASSTVEVLKMDVEASSFPAQIASVESGSGMVRVDLYNTNDDQTRYDLNLEGLPSTWTSQSEKQVILDKGERRTVYFYLTPQDEGSYEPTISVRSRGSEIYREKLDVITGGTTESRPRDRSFFGSVAEGLSGLFNF